MVGRVRLGTAKRKGGVEVCTRRAAWTLFSLSSMPNGFLTFGQISKTNEIT